MADKSESQAAQAASSFTSQHLPLRNVATGAINQMDASRLQVALYQKNQKEENANNAIRNSCVRVLVYQIFCISAIAVLEITPLACNSKEIRGSHVYSLL